MLPLAVAEVVTDVIVWKIVDPYTVVPTEPPVIFSVIVVPDKLVPVTVKVFPVSLAEQYTLTTAFKLFASFNFPLRDNVPATPGFASWYKLSASFT